MLSAQFFTDAAARAKNGHPAHSTIGEASASSTQCATPGEKRPPISIATSGTASAALAQKRRVMSLSSGFSAGAAASIGSSAMPQIGQGPGFSARTSGCMGQVQSVPSGAGAGGGGGAR